MSTLPELTVKNIKASLLLSEAIENIPKENIFTYRNIIVTIYKHTPTLVNVTKVRNYEELLKISFKIQKKFQTRIQKIRIDSIMMSRRVFGKRYAEKKYLNVLKKYRHIYRHEFFPELFHGSWFKAVQDRRAGSFNIFSTGSCCVMGVKAKKYIILIKKILAEAFCPENEIITRPTEE